MTVSSAFIVPYEVRPSKQIERRIILDLIQIARDAGYDVRNSQYIGFGGFKYVDFLLMNRYVGFSDMLSIEYDSKAIGRCEFNKPFANIKLYRGSFNDFLKSKKLSKPCVAWLDYDGPISADISSDLTECGVKLPLDSIVFFTIDAEPKKVFKSQTPVERRDYFHENFQSAANIYTEADFENEVFHKTSSSVLFKLVVNSFAQRADAEFFPLFFSLYRDTTWMCTVGGIWSDPNNKKSQLLHKYAKQAVPGLIVSKVQPKVKEIPQINISESERRLLDQIATQSKRKSKERALAKKLGFTSDYIKKYKQIIRYIPRFIETAV